MEVLIHILALAIIAFIAAMIACFVLTTVIGLWKIVNRGVQK